MWVGKGGWIWEELMKERTWPKIVWNSQRTNKKLLKDQREGLVIKRVYCSRREPMFSF